MIKLKDITPVYTSILTTFDKYSMPATIGDSKIIDPTKACDMVKEYQTVLKVGNMVKLVKPGDIIAINPMKYAQYKQVKQNSLREDLESYKKDIVGFNFPTIELNDVERGLFDERDILYIVNEFSEDNNTPQK